VGGNRGGYECAARIHRFARRWSCSARPFRWTLKGYPSNCLSGVELLGRGPSLPLPARRFEVARIVLLACGRDGGVDLAGAGRAHDAVCVGAVALAMMAIPFALAKDSVATAPAAGRR
jgi:hypothetical protein